VYLPLDWLAEAEVDPGELVARPAFSPALGRLVARLLDAAEAYYRRADQGIALLPRSCRLPIRAARLVYAEIGREVRRNRHDSVTRRAYTSKLRKAWLVLRSLPVLLWRPRPPTAPVCPAVRFLLEAVAAEAER
jgi:phytoene synthase